MKLKDIILTKEQIESIRNELIENSQSSQISPSLSSLLSVILYIFN